MPTERRKDTAARAEFLNAADVAILCLPDDAAEESVSLIANEHTRVIDASTAHRVADGWAYGFAEMDKRPGARRSPAAKRVANPGCWPQGPIATLRPLIEAGLLPADYPVTMNGISGYTGGGRAMIEDYVGKGEDAPEFLPYGLTFQHKHVPELRKYAGLARDPLMQPAVGNFAQGMITWCRCSSTALERVPTGAELHAAIADHYAGIEGGVGRRRALRAGRAHAGDRSRDLQRHQPHAAPCLRQRQAGAGAAASRSTTISARARRVPPCRTWT